MEETFYIDPRRYHGRPVRSTGPDSCADPIDRAPQELACYDLLDSLGILYDRVDHSHADTIEACHAVEQVLGWPVCKNLFLCNRQKTQYYLLMLEGDKVFKTKDLSKQLGVARLSFAGPEDMERLLGVKPGSVTVLGLRQDTENRRVVIAVIAQRLVVEAGVHDYVASHSYGRRHEILRRGLHDGARALRRGSFRRGGSFRLRRGRLSRFVSAARERGDYNSAYDQDDEHRQGYQRNFKLAVHYTYLAWVRL